MRLILAFVFIISLSSYSQDGMYNVGSDLTLYVGQDHVVRVVGEFQNLASATVEFENGGTPTIELEGDFTNSTSGIYTLGTELIHFLGSTAQNVDFGGDPFYSGQIDNTENATLSRAATVMSDFNFSSGDINSTSTNYLEFEVNATASNVSDASHVNGTAQKKFETISKFTYPVGNGTFYRPAALTQQSTSAVTYKTTYVREAYSDLTVTGVIERVSTREYWDISRESGTTDATLELSWRSNSEVDNIDSLAIAYYDGADWAFAGNENITGTTTSGTLETTANWSTWGNRLFTLATTDMTLNPLPIELIAFDVISQNNEVEVKWSTATEINTSHFILMHSTDGINYSPIETIGASGNSSNIKNYSYTHLNPSQGINYYQIIDVDFNETINTNPIKSINLNNNISFNLTSVFPIPCSDLLNIQIESKKESSLNISVISSLGSVAINKIIQINEGKNTTTLNTNNLSPGTYYLRFFNSEELYKIVKFTKI